MVITEVFPNPTVKQVVFEIKFPNSFYIEDKIGALQYKIMKEFPESNLLYRRQIMFADLGPEGKLKPLDETMGKKIWEFKAEKKYRLHITSSTLNIFSEYHKTYNLDGADKFKDAIKFVLKNFFEVMAIPILNRVGLRYIDECPLEPKDNETFSSYYDSVFPIERFNIADANEMVFRTVAKRGELNIIYMEELRKVKDQWKLILDFDGFAQKVKPEDCLSVTDKLHEIITEEYERTIKEPVYKYMRRKN